MIEDQVYSTWLCTELLNSAQAQVQPRRSWFLRRDMGGTQVSMLFKILHRCLWYTHVQSRITGLDRGTNKYHLGTSLWRRQWQPTPVLLPGKSHGWSSPIGCSPRVAKSWAWLGDFTFTFHFHALEKEMATYSSILAWKIPGTEEPGGLLSMGSHRVGHDWSDLAVAAGTSLMA